VDTRSKILTLDAARGLPAQPLALVTGAFDVLRAEHVRELQGMRSRAFGNALLVVVLPCPGAVLHQRARAELVAALRMVDYVVAAAYEEVDRLIEALKPQQILRLEAADARRARQLMEHVQRRQTS
jgi:bifunctional ADP-heptose synthase (sugar kinase/adenylyltransferase)